MPKKLFKEFKNLLEDFEEDLVNMSSKSLIDSRSKSYQRGTHLSQSQEKMDLNIVEKKNCH